MASSYVLGDAQKGFVNELVGLGRYNSKSEVIREAIRLLQDREEQREMKLETLRKAFQEGIDSGHGEDADTVFDRLEAKYSAMNGTNQ